MKWMISCHDGKHRNDFSTVGKHLDTHCSRCAKTCRKFLQYQSVHRPEKSSNKGKEGELLRPLLVAFWRIENTQFPAVLGTSGARLIDIWSLLREASSQVDTARNTSCEHASSSANFMVSATKQRFPSLAQGVSFRHTQGRSLLRVRSLR